MKTALTRAKDILGGGNSMLLVLAVFMGITLGQMGPITQPFQVGALIDGARRTALEAGSLMGVQTACFSLALLAFARFARKLGLARAGLLGAALSIAAFAIMYIASAMKLLYGATALAGAGQGIIFGAALAAGAGTPNPERIYGIGATVAIVIAGVFMACVPFARQALNERGVFVALCILLLILAPTLVGLGGRGLTQQSPQDGSEKVASAMALFAMLILFGVGVGATYTFAERVGVQLGLGQERIGIIFMISTIAGASGSIAAAWVGLRWGRSLPLYVSLLATGLACLTLAGAWNSWVYSAGLLAFQITYTSCFPFQIGAAAGLDRRGRLAAFCGGIHFLALALGAQVGGLLAHYFSFAAIGFFALAMCVLAALAIPHVVRAFELHGNAPLEKC